ncbi:MAG: HyaD/HybD family hydrogenase maturation endopeptidase [Gammaproteobacteria bacterium]|nr:HyaD/HybD family hydrogenase maturation endopeptidase [Gammaproteobacteria bacterium]
MNKVLVLGLGNTLQTDEGIGVHVVHHLQKNNQYPEAVYVDGGTHSFRLSELLENNRHLIVIDTVELNSEPGSVAVFTNDEMDDFVANGAKSSAHEIGLKDMLSMALLQDRLPEKRALIGIQPAQFGWGCEPSEQVAAAIPRVVEQVKIIMEGWR